MVESQIAPRIIAVGVLITVLALSGCQGGSSTTEDAMPSPIHDGPSVADEGLCNPAEFEGELRSLSIGNSVGSFTEAYVAWGEKEGCFAEFGLDVESVPGGGQDKISALVGGSLDVAAENLVTFTVTRANSDIDLRILTGHSEITDEILTHARENPGLDDGKLIMDAALILGAQSEVSSIAELKGARISVSAPPSPNTIGLTRALASASLSPSDTELIPLGSAEGLNALLAGEVDAAILLGARAYQAISEGGRVLFYPGAYFYQPGTVTAWLTTGARVEEKEAELSAFRNAMASIYTLLQGDAGRDSFRQFLLDEFEFTSEALEQFTFPPLVTRKVTSEEFDYLVEELSIEGFLDREIRMTDEILVP